MPLPTADEAPAVVVLQSVERRYPSPGGPVFALRSVDLELAEACLVAVVGSSGSGKSTLLNVIAGVDRITGGRVLVGETDLAALGPNAAARWRAGNCGVVLQSQQLIPTLTVAENVRLAMDVSRVLPKAERAGRVREVLALVDLHQLGDRFPDQLSGGQQQRAAVARAVANRPRLIVADEPTAALDSATAGAVFSLLLDVVAQQGTTIVCSTHDEALARRADRIVRLQDGQVV